MEPWTDKGTEGIKRFDRIPKHIEEYIKDIIGVVEASEYEYHSLWREYTGEGYSWKELSYGYSEAVGDINNRPIYISLRTAVVDGKKILFIHGTSTLVDWDLIGEWLEKFIPTSARDKNDKINKADADSFYNIFNIQEI